jgi:hypothetical protein
MAFTCVPSIFRWTTAQRWELAARVSGAKRKKTGAGEVAMTNDRPWRLADLTFVPLCSEAAKLDRFWLESSALIPWLGGAQRDEGIEVFGRPEGVYSQARG